MKNLIRVLFEKRILNCKKRKLLLFYLACTFLTKKRDNFPPRLDEETQSDFGKRFVRR